MAFTFNGFSFARAVGSAAAGCARCGRAGGLQRCKSEREAAGRLVHSWRGTHAQALLVRQRAASSAPQALPTGPFSGGWRPGRLPHPTKAARRGAFRAWDPRARHGRKAWGGRAEGDERGEREEKASSWATASEERRRNRKKKRRRKKGGPRALMPARVMTVAGLPRMSRASVPCTARQAGAARTALGPLAPPQQAPAQPCGPAPTQVCRLQARMPAPGGGPAREARRNPRRPLPHPPLPAPALCLACTAKSAMMTQLRGSSHLRGGNRDREGLRGGRRALTVCAPGEGVWLGGVGGEGDKRGAEGWPTCIAPWRGGRTKGRDAQEGRSAARRERRVAGNKASARKGRMAGGAGRGPLTRPRRARATRPTGAWRGWP